MLFLVISNPIPKLVRFPTLKGRFRQFRGFEYEVAETVIVNRHPTKPFCCRLQQKCCNSIKCDLTGIFESNSNFIAQMTCIFFNDKIGALYHGRPIQYIRPNFFEDKDKGWNCGLVWVSITSENRKCPKNRKLPEKQWEQPDNVIFLFSQICRIQTKNVGIIPKMMLSIWFWSQISINATKNEKNWHFIWQPIIFNVKV